MPGNYIRSELASVASHWLATFCEQGEGGKGRRAAVPICEFCTQSGHICVDNPVRGCSNDSRFETNHQTCCDDWPAEFCFDWGSGRFTATSPRVRKMRMMHDTGRNTTVGGCQISELGAGPIKPAISRSLIGAQRFVHDRGRIWAEACPSAP